MEPFRHPYFATVLRTYISWENECNNNVGTQQCSNDHDPDKIFLSWFKIAFIYLEEYFTSWGNFDHTGVFSMSEDIVGFTTGRCYQHLVGGGRGCCKHSTCIGWPRPQGVISPRCAWCQGWDTLASSFQWKCNFLGGFFSIRKWASH